MGVNVYDEHRFSTIHPPNGTHEVNVVLLPHACARPDLQAAQRSRCSAFDLHQCMNRFPRCIIYNLLIPMLINPLGFPSPRQTSLLCLLLLSPLIDQSVVHFSCHFRTPSILYDVLQLGPMSLRQGWGCRVFSELLQIVPNLETHLREDATKITNVNGCLFQIRFGCIYHRTQATWPCHTMQYLVILHGCLHRSWP
jgi:hypothetical protein